ncbi:MAG: thioredoxin-disulfide reductase, partial [Dehalococcoidia bacterium]|nr:thioredoxin-disulfide reductase [Dehalococcoidia bacterium]
GVFVATGSTPNTEFLEGLLALNSSAQVPTNSAMETKIVGLFAAGMASEGHATHPAVAIGEGIVAAESAKRFVDKR